MGSPKFDHSSEKFTLFLTLPGEKSKKEFNFKYSEMAESLINWTVETIKDTSRNRRNQNEMTDLTHMKLFFDKNSVPALSNKKRRARRNDPTQLQKHIQMLINLINKSDSPFIKKLCEYYVTPNSNRFPNLPFTSQFIESDDVEKHIIGDIYDDRTGIKGIIVNKLHATETKPISEGSGRLLLNNDKNDIKMVNSRIQANGSNNFDPKTSYKQHDKVYVNLSDDSLKYVEATIYEINPRGINITYNLPGPIGELTHYELVYTDMISLKDHGLHSSGGNKFSKKKISKRTNPKKKSPKLKKTSKTKTKKPSKTKTKKPTKTSKTKSKKSPKIHIGPRGGEYIVKKGKKIYQ